MSIGPGTTLFGRFVVERSLGLGGAAEVWGARDRESDSLVALKVLRPEMRRRKQMVERLATEAAVLENLRHPGIARALGYFQDAENVALAMEYVPGATLDQYLSTHSLRRAQTPLVEVTRIFLGILDAVEHAHLNGVLHRDLKPQNIMLVEGTGAIKVLDFGIAKLLVEDIHDATTQGRRIGSPYYMSPEQTRGEAASERSDIFALGSILFELLTLRRAWVRNDRGEPLVAFGEEQADQRINALPEVTARIASAERPRASNYRPELAEPVEQLLLSAMAIDAADRPASVAALRDEVRAVFESETRVLTQTRLLEPTLVKTAATDVRTKLLSPRTPRRWPYAALVAGAVVMGVVLYPRTELPQARTEPAVGRVVEAERPQVAARPVPAEVVDPEEADEVERSPVREERAPRKSLAKRTEPAPVQKVDVVRPLVILLADVKANPGDAARMHRLGKAIAAAAHEQVADLNKRRRIVRIAEQSALAAQADGLEQALDELRREVAP